MTVKIIFGLFVYIVPTFALAYFWHLKWFKELYERWDYAGANPSIPLGFLSITLQGILLSLVYAFAPINHTSLLTAFGLFGLVGFFHWTVHVLAAMAKNERMRTLGYFGFETLYLVLQFGIFALLISSVVY